MRGFAGAFVFVSVGVLASPATPVHAQTAFTQSAAGQGGAPQTAPAPPGSPAAAPRQNAPQQPVPRPTDAQDHGAAIPTDTTFRTSTELVALNVTVTDTRHQYLKGLKKEDFAVFEDGVPQDVSFFATTSLPLDLTIMIDTSASMSDKITFVRQAATNFVHTLRPGDRAEVIGFSDRANVLAPFTGDVPTLDAAINSTTPHGSTALYTSLYIAVEDLARLARQHADIRRQAIVVLTDGEDTSSMLSFDDLMDAAKRAGMAVYTISVVSPFDTKKVDDSGRRFSNESDFALRSLAQETGARSFFPMELRDLNGVYQEIADELSSQYSIGYIPRVHGDGAFHRLFVRVLHHPDASSRTRSGYYSSRPVRAFLIGGENR
jgi:Ca-activated chloride channel family protein